MPWIDVPDEDDWEGELAVFRETIREPDTGRVDNILAIHGLDLGSMQAHQQLYEQAMRGTKTLRKVEREMVALVVSSINECHY